MQISEVKEYLQLTEDSYSEDTPDDLFTAAGISGPELLFGNTISAPKTDVIAALPPRPVADRLISLYLNSKESTLGNVSQTSQTLSIVLIDRNFSCTFPHLQKR
jgi:hypothetical protein